MPARGQRRALAFFVTFFVPAKPGQEREVPDILWAPWRIEYIAGPKEKDCIFCRFLTENRDDENLIVHRGRRAYVIMNRYPYSNGHLMVLPNRHTWDFTSLDAEERDELFTLMQRAVTALGKGFKPEGLNIGMNLGKAAGAGIEEHLHYHVVPRWVGDCNYMTVLGDVRVIPEHIQVSFQKLRELFI